MKYLYTVLVETYDLESPFTYGADIADCAAKDFHSSHDGWECSWPLEFLILREDGSEVGLYSVERESEPVFYAYEVKEKV